MSSFAIVHLEALQRLKGDYSIKVLFVYAGLASHADTDGWCYPGQEAIAKAGAVCTKTVRSHMPTLVEAGLVEIHKQKTDDGKTYYYLPLLDSRETCLPTESRGSMLPVDGEACCPSEGKQVTGQEQTINRPIEQTNSCEPDEKAFKLNESKRKKPKADPLNGIEYPDGFDQADVRQALRDYLAHRKTLYKNPARSLSLMLKKFAGFTPQVFIDAVELTEANGWTGVFTPKGNNHEQTRKHFGRDGGPIRRTPGRVYDD